jgi:hypothetical protein
MNGIICNRNTEKGTEEKETIGTDEFDFAPFSINYGESAQPTDPWFRPMTRKPLMIQWFS